MLGQQRQPAHGPNNSCNNIAVRHFAASGEQAAVGARCQYQSALAVEDGWAGISPVIQKGGFSGPREVEERAELVGEWIRLLRGQGQWQMHPPNQYPLLSHGDQHWSPWLCASERERN